MKLIDWLNSLRPALPMSSERPCEVMSQSELRRHIRSGAVLVNGCAISADEFMDFPVFSLVFFPHGKRKTTIV